LLPPIRAINMIITLFVENGKKRDGVRGNFKFQKNITANKHERNTEEFTMRD
jgi:hypothetical protein